MPSQQVTVFIPTFNRLELLKTAVESVLSQGAAVWLHVLDNASTDGTAVWLRQLKEENNNVAITIRDKNIGSIANYIDAFSKVDTPYLVPLADDDTLLPGFLEEALRLAERHPQVGAVVFQAEIRTNGRCQWKSPMTPIEGVADPREHLPRWMADGHYVSWSAILWSTAAVRSITPAETFKKFDLASDVWFEFRVFLRYPVYLVRKCGATFNLSPNQASSVMGASVQAMSWFADMAVAMREELLASRLYPEARVRELMQSQLVYWNKHVLSRELPSVVYDDHTIEQLLAIYMERYFPICGFAAFPLANVLLSRRMKDFNPVASTHFAPIENKLGRKLGLVKHIIRMLTPPFVHDLLKFLRNGRAS